MNLFHSKGVAEQDQDYLLGRISSSNNQEIKEDLNKFYFEECQEAQSRALIRVAIRYKNEFSLEAEHFLVKQTQKVKQDDIPHRCG